MNKKILAVAFALCMAVVLSGAVAAADNNTTTTTTTDQLQATSSTNTTLPDPTNTRTGISYTTIQAAIDSVFTQNGDTIQCAAGTYPEDVLVSKSLHIIGVDAATTFVKSFYIPTSGSGSEITGFTVTGGTGEAITLQDASNCNVDDNVISGGYSAGVALINSDNNRINSNVIDGSVAANYYGIYLDNSKGNFIGWNGVINCIRDGIWLLNSDNNTILYDNIGSNGMNGIVVEDSDYNKIWHNGIHSNVGDGILFTDSIGTDIFVNSINNNVQDGVHIEAGSDSTTITETHIYNNGHIGIYTENSYNTLINNNELDHNFIAIILSFESNNSTISNNNIHDNTGVGVSVYSGNNQINNNTIYNNIQEGLTFQQSNNNYISGNNINNNLAGIDFITSDNNTVYENQVYNNKAEGISVDQSNYMTIDSNNIHDNLMTGIIGGNGIDRVVGLDIVNNTINNNDYGGILLGRCDDFEISHNTIKNNTDNININKDMGNGIELDNCTNGLIDHNTIENNTNNGIKVKDSTGDEINANTIDNNGLTTHDDGIYLTNSPETNIKNNDISSEHGGVSITNSDNVTVFQNNIHDNTYGVFISGSSDDVNVNFNRIVDNNIWSNLNSDTSGDVDATLNWWGYNGASDVAARIHNFGSGTLTYNSWIVLTINASPTTVGISGTSTITADLLHDSNGTYHNPTNGVVPYEGAAFFATTKGSIVDVNFSNGTATSTLTNLTTSGTAVVSSTVDHQTVHANVVVNPAATIAQIVTAAGTVKTYYEVNHVLPANVLVGTTNVSMPQFLYLLVTATRNINLGNLNPINITPVNPAAAPSGTYTPGSLVKSSYLSVALNIQNFIIANGRAPNYAQTSLGKIPFSKLVYMYSKVINFYGTSIPKKLPNYVTI